MRLLRGCEPWARLWLQLIKLACSFTVETPWFLILDADTFFLSPLEALDLMQQKACTPPFRRVRPEAPGAPPPPPPCLRLSFRACAMKHATPASLDIGIISSATAAGVRTLRCWVAVGKGCCVKTWQFIRAHPNLLRLMCCGGHAPEDMLCIRAGTCRGQEKGHRKAAVLERGAGAVPRAQRDDPVGGRGSVCLDLLLRQDAACERRCPPPPPGG